MIRKLFQTLDEKERAYRKSFGRDITDPVERKRSLWHMRWLDHGILRIWWHNFDEFAPGAYRSNQPDHMRFTAYAERGIKTVLNLRGEQKQPHYLFEAESAETLGLTLISVHMSARRAPKRKILLRLLEVFETIERPFLLHCKSGADRAGLAAALWLLHMEQRPVAEAQRQLGLRYAHLKHTRTGIMDQILECYAEDIRETPMPIRQWFETRYDPDQVEAAFARKQGRAA